METHESNTIKRVPVSEVRTGMYVISLDRSWIATPFFFHRRKIKSAQDIERLKKHGIREVVIDTKYGVDVGSSTAENGETTEAPPPELEVRRGNTSEVPFRILVEEFEIAREVHAEALATTQAIFDGAGRGAPVPPTMAKKVVDDLSKCILRSPDASLLLTQMRRFQNDLFTHAVNVCVLSLVVGMAEGFEENHGLGFGALFHDVGQTRLPRNVLRKRDPLTESERRLISQHPTLGFNILERSEGVPDLARRIVIEHHERINGSGYPARLQGDQISVFSQIVAITDAYDAMLLGRNHAALQPIEVLRQIYLDAQSGAFNQRLVERVIHALGIYPIGSLVELNTGELGVVIAANRNDSLKPTLRLIPSRNLPAEHAGSVIRLAEQEPGVAERRVVRVLDPGKEGIDIIAHLQTAAGSYVA